MEVTRGSLQYTRSFAAYTLDLRTLAHRSHAGSYRLGAARGVLRDLSSARAVRAHRGSLGWDGGAARPRLVAATAHPAAACAVSGAGADSGRSDAAAAHSALQPVEADRALLGGERRLHREFLDRRAHAHAARPRSGARGAAAGERCDVAAAQPVVGGVLCRARRTQPCSGALRQRARLGQLQDVRTYAPDLRVRRTAGAVAQHPPGRPARRTRNSPWVSRSWCRCGPRSSARSRPPRSRSSTTARPTPATPARAAAVTFASRWCRMPSAAAASSSVTGWFMPRSRPS